MRDLERREFCRSSVGWMVGTAVLGATSAAAQARGQEKPAAEAEEVAPAEDLMREHGVLNRVLLIYEELMRRLKAEKDFDVAVLLSAAGLIRNFVEDYHEKLEEDHLFPRFEKAGKLTGLVAVLRTQHRAGRRLTDQIRQLAKPGVAKDAEGRRRLSEKLGLFVRMYRPHEAREDTVLFPAIRSVVTPNEYDALGEEFEDKEHQIFGADGFERIVGDVAKLEKAVGIYDLAQFTPRV